MIRVAMVMGRMCGGGVESVVMNYYRRIDKSRVQFDFLVDDDSTDVPFGEVADLGGRVFEVPPYRQLNRYLPHLRQLFAREQWPIVHSHLNALSVFPLSAAESAGVPVRIAHSHSTAGKGEPLRNFAKTLLRTQSNRFPTARFACSREAGLWLFGPRRCFDVVPNALELDAYKFNLESRRSVRSELGVSAGTFVVGHIGRFVSQKNQQFLLEVFGRLLRKRPDSALVLVGEGRQRAAAQEWVSANGVRDKVLFLGQRVDTPRLYSAFDAFALPSLYEGLGMVAIEAQRSGLPCVLSERVPREAVLTQHVSVAPLSDMSRWVSELSDIPVGQSRDVRSEMFRNYDIEAAANELVVRYETLLTRAGRGWSL